MGRLKGFGLRADTVPESSHLEPTMTRLARVLAFFAAVTVEFLAPSCKQPAADKKEGKPKGSDNSTPQPSPSSSPTSRPSDDGCDNKSTDKNSDSSTTTDTSNGDDWNLRGLGRGLGLVDTVTYEDVQSIFESECVTCHKSGGK